MDLIDTHCHLDVEDFDDDRGQVLAQCRQNGVRRIVVPAIEAETWDRVVALCRSENGLFPALGMHPIYIDRHKDEHLLLLERCMGEQHPIAVGEIGLDYFVKDLDRDRQLYFVEAQLRLAQDAGLPVLLHIRKAHDDMLQLLKKARVRGGIAHAFNGSLQQAHQYLDLGFKLGFGGMLTFERSSKLRRLAKALPLEAIVLETDAPDMTVASHRGERNSPAYLPECLQALAEVREADPGELAEHTTQNALSVLNLH